MVAFDEMQEARFAKRAARHGNGWFTRFGRSIAQLSTRMVLAARPNDPYQPFWGWPGLKPLAAFVVYTVAAENALKTTNKMNNAE
jgi:hypothetical protein